MKLSYRIYGRSAARAVVLLHGLLGSRDNWHSFASEYQDRYRFIVPDLVNHGDSPHIDRFDYGSMAADIEELLDDMDVGAVTMIGHSMGGKVAMEFALERPHRITTIVVEDMTPGKTQPRYRRYVEALLSMDIESVGSRRDAERMLEERIADRTLRLFLLKNLARNEDGSYRWRAHLSAIASAYEAIWRALPTGRSYEGPALFVRGEHSDVLTDDRIPEVRRYFPRAEIETINEAGHWVHALHQDAFAAVVLPFLGEA